MVQLLEYNIVQCIVMNGEFVSGTHSAALHGNSLLHATQKCMWMCIYPYIKDSKGEEGM